MKKNYLVSVGLVVVCIFFIAFSTNQQADYSNLYYAQLNAFTTGQRELLQTIQNADLSKPEDIRQIKADINTTRLTMKRMDFWMRYLEPLAYKQINGPLPVEWETEAFEKFEKPYKREGSGFTLATQYLDGEHLHKDSLLAYIKASLAATQAFGADSVTSLLHTYHHFYLCNRLFLLNLAAIYTTGFETADPATVVPELRTMLEGVNEIYTAFNHSFPATPLPANYMELANAMHQFAATQPSDYTRFDHFTFIRDYVNPLFTINQQLILQYHVVSRSMIDYSLNKQAKSIFDKALYNAQNPKGMYIRVEDTAALAEIEKTGKLLFYDPLLSGNNQRSCASCHQPAAYFTDTTISAPLSYNRKDLLSRNAPSLVNCVYNHLLMLDGKHINLINQTKAVITNPDEMNCTEEEVLKKVQSCNEYKFTFKKLVKLTPQEKEITFEHIISAITYYYSKFSSCYSTFDNAMNRTGGLDNAAHEGFNLFMGKARCGTCHFVPQFNGVKPPFVSSEFEVLGVPADTIFHHLSEDSGRYTINPAQETRNAFRTGSLRNVMHTAPYMHNGVFTTMEQVIDFYNNGGGTGRGLRVNNQTLSGDSLKLTNAEKSQLIAFMRSLDEHIIFEKAPEQLPRSGIKALNKRKTGGEY